MFATRHISRIHESAVLSASLALQRIPILIRKERASGRTCACDRHVGMHKAGEVLVPAQRGAAGRIERQ